MDTLKPFNSIDYKLLNKQQISPHVLAITSGKGGVGKTLSCVNIAVSAQKLGLRTLILDGDMGLANVDVVLGLQPRYNINDVLEGHAELSQIILEGPSGIRIIPSGSGIAQLTQLSYIDKLNLVEQVDALNEEFDLLIIDTGAGISDQVIHFNVISDQSVVVTTPEPHAMTDAYALIKVMSENKRKKSINLLVNQVHSEQEGLKVFHRLAEVAQRFLDTPIKYLGHVPMDPQIQKFVVQRNAASHLFSRTCAGQAWRKITKNLCESLITKSTQARSPTQVWRELIWSQQASANAF